MTDTKTRTWTITIPAPVRIVSANAEGDWRRGPNHRAIRDTAYARIATSGIARGLTLVRVDLEIRFPRNAARRNETNYHPTVGKPVVDALGPERRYVISKGARKGQTVLERGYGVITDDTSPPLHCPDCPHIRFGAPTGRDPRRPFGELVLVVTDLSGGAS